MKALIIFTVFIAPALFLMYKVVELAQTLGL